MKMKRMRRILTVAAVAAAGATAGAPALAQQPGSSAAAKAHLCVGCHEIPGLRSVYPEVYPVPKIIGQNALYIATALRAYRAGDRAHPSMTSVAAQLSDDDITALSEYYAELAR